MSDQESENEPMQPVLNAALPIFALILTGYVAARLEILGRAPRTASTGSPSSSPCRPSSSRR
jgi:hypothetical protein